MCNFSIWLSQLLSGVIIFIIMVFCEENRKEENIVFFFFTELIALHQGLIISELFIKEDNYNKHDHKEEKSWEKE